MVRRFILVTHRWIGLLTSAILALVGSSGYVEISVNQGSALKAGIHKGATVTATP